MDNQSCVAEIAFNCETRRDNNNFRLDLTNNIIEDGEDRSSLLKELNDPLTIVFLKVFLSRDSCLGFLTYMDVLRLS